MTEKDAIHGLACPNCGGMVPIPEGQVIVRCPFCEQRSLVRGDRGYPRYQVFVQVERKQAETTLKRFLTSHQAIARDAARLAVLDEAFIAYLPFWTSWARVLGWVFGQKRVGSGDDARYEPREVQVVEESTWNGAACDVGEFGVTDVNLESQPLDVFDPDALHRSGMVFEPVGSLSEAQESAQLYFEERVHDAAHLDRIAQVFIRLVKKRFGIVYYPLWVMRYLYRGRAFQVAVDGFSGQVLYGKAPGNTFYRALILVGGMAIGAFLAVDASVAALAAAFRVDDGDATSGLLFGALVLLVAGLGIMAAAYRTFRLGEQYEFRRGRSAIANIFQAKEIFSQIQDVEQWVNRLS